MTTRDELQKRGIILIAFILFTAMTLFSLQDFTITGNVVGTSGPLLTILTEKMTATKFKFTAQGTDNGQLITSTNCSITIAGATTTMTQQQQYAVFEKELSEQEYNWSITCMVNALELTKIGTVIQTEVQENQANQTTQEMIEEINTTVLTVTSPSHLSVQNKTIFFSWLVENGTQQSFDITLAKNEGLSDGAIHITERSSQQIAFFFAESGTTYYWKINVTTKNGTKESSLFRFSTQKEPTIQTIALTATSQRNKTRDNLTLTITHADVAQPIKDIINWKHNEETIFLAYFPFKASMKGKDYSGNENKLTTENIFEATDQEGFSAVGFSNSTLSITDLGKRDQFTLVLTFKPEMEGTIFLSEDLVIVGENQTLSVKIKDVNKTVLQTTYKNEWQTLAFRKNKTTAALFLNTHLVQEKHTTKTIELNGILLGSGWKGTLGEVRLYKRALSTEQMTQPLNTISAAELQVEDTWSAEVTPVTNTQEGKTVSSNVLKIVSSTINMTLTNPKENYAQTEKELLVQWELPAYANDEEHSFTVFLDDAPNFTTPISTFKTTNTSQLLQNLLAGTYYVKVQMEDPTTPLITDPVSFHVLDMVGCTIDRSSLGVTDLLNEQDQGVTIQNTGTTPLTAYLNASATNTAIWIIVKNGPYGMAQTSWKRLPQKEAIITSLPKNTSATAQFRLELQANHTIEKTPVEIICQKT